MGVDRKRKTGLGDIALWTALSNHYKPPFVWGFGPTIMLNTATDDMLGTGKWQLRLLFIPVLPSPEWARKPLFN